tara:strand:+ start:1539 stop:2663 length:1125 start_codon:yes stop_codon:yes gene_type:complete
MNLTKPRLDQFKITGSTVGDVYFPKTKLLLPLDGSNGATTTSDSSNSNHTITFAGNAQISTAQSKFGGSSLYLDGSGDEIDLGSSSDWNWPTPSGASGDFTIEFWHRRTATTNWGSFFSTYNAIGSAGFVFGYSGTTNKLAWYNSAWVYASNGGNTTLAVDTWYHIVAVRYGSTTKFYLNGLEEYSFTDSASYGTAKLWLGGRGGDTYVEGYMDDVRITKGLARYTSAFTPPTTAHLTSAGDVNKQIIVNSTADGVAIGTGGINQARIAKAWVNFNGTGTVAIRGSYNISSITDNGTGDYTLNYSTSLGDENYAVTGCTGNVYNSAGTVFTSTWVASLTTALTSSATRVIGVYRTGTSNVNWDGADLYYQVFGN